RGEFGALLRANSPLEGGQGGVTDDNFNPDCSFFSKTGNFRITHGSNTFAIAPSRSADGKTRLAINSHQPWEGPAAWYEAHLKSEEGWDMVGGLFPGSPVILHGHNRHLGWAHTVNRPDLIDVYVLEINPDNPEQYKFDGEWQELDIRETPIRVKLFGPFYWTVKREVLWSIHGPVVRQPHGTYAIRIAGYGRIRQIEQWYRMNKAQNFSEWQEAMRIGAMPMFNTGYADKDGNIFYIYNGLLPKRAEGYDWSKYLPGNSSETIWDEYLPFEKLPQVNNPLSGFIQNCNSSPFRTTIGPGNPDSASYTSTYGIETRMTNRSLRALELFGFDESITPDEFYAYKFDIKYSKKSAMAGILRKLLDVSAPQDSLLQNALDELKGWELRTDKQSTGAALAVLSFQRYFSANLDTLQTSTLLARLKKTARKLQQKFDRLDVPWGDVNRLIRGEVDLSLDGGPDVLRAVYGRLRDDGRLQGSAGDCYVLLVEWDQDGTVHSQSVHQYGSATLDQTSPHYADQTELFANLKMKPVWINEAEIRANLEAEYRPGERKNSNRE
ncbi:MAG: acylase, partial [bacterium]